MSSEDGRSVWSSPPPPQVKALTDLILKRPGEYEAEGFMVLGIGGLVPNVFATKAEAAKYAQPYEEIKKVVISLEPA